VAEVAEWKYVQRVLAATEPASYLGDEVESKQTSCTIVDATVVSSV
jgi:hypothetical protein